VKHLPIVRTKPWRVSQWGKVLFDGSLLDCRATKRRFTKAHGNICLVVERNV
jgi:hypothetical protein